MGRFRWFWYFLHSKYVTIMEIFKIKKLRISLSLTLMRRLNVQVYNSLVEHKNGLLQNCHFFTKLKTIQCGVQHVRHDLDLLFEHHIQITNIPIVHMRQSQNRWKMWHKLLLPLNGQLYKGFRMAYWHLILTHTKGQGKVKLMHTSTDGDRSGRNYDYHQILSCFVGFRLAYLYLTLPHSTGVDQSHTHFVSEYIKAVNDKITITIK